MKGERGPWDEVPTHSQEPGSKARRHGSSPMRRVVFR